ncbi:MAG TPA: HAD hydrolase family protein, partial [Deinococcales bacterium]|nr:HAD hydrolase family protein [Deinococcales bacterium]
MLPLVIVDLDGTMIGKSGQVLPCVWQGVDRLLEAGVKLAVCTGRPGMGVALRVAERIGPRNPHIFNNGALVTYVDGDTQHAAALKESDVLDLISHARRLG